MSCLFDDGAKCTCCLCTHPVGLLPGIIPTDVPMHKLMDMTLKQIVHNERWPSVLQRLPHGETMRCIERISYLIHRYDGDLERFILLLPNPEERLLCNIVASFVSATMGSRVWYGGSSRILLPADRRPAAVMSLCNATKGLGHCVVLGQDGPYILDGPDDLYACLSVLATELNGVVAVLETQHCIMGDIVFVYRRDLASDHAVNALAERLFWAYFKEQIRGPCAVFCKGRQPAPFQVDTDGFLKPCEVGPGLFYPVKVAAASLLDEQVMAVWKTLHVAADKCDFYAHRGDRSKLTLVSMAYYDAYNCMVSSTPFHFTMPDVGSEYEFLSYLSNVLVQVMYVVQKRTACATFASIRETLRFMSQRIATLSQA